MAYWQPRDEEKGLKGENEVKWARGMGVFIGLKSWGRSVLRGVRPVLLHSGLKAVSYDQVLLSGFYE